LATYRIAVGGQAPLQLQLGGGLGGGTVVGGTVVKVREVGVEGEKATGGTTEPTLSRPATPGTGSTIWGANDLSVEGLNVPPVAPILTSYSSSPTLPVAGGSIITLPPIRRFVFPRGSEFIIYPAGALLLYAKTSGVFTWAAEICWEEV
jgi:hypothetical protein